jgi:hypothetical protein
MVQKVRNETLEADTQQEWVEDTTPSVSAVETVTVSCESKLGLHGTHSDG